MKYFIKYRKWSKARNHDIWVGENFDSRVSIRYAGVYSEDDKKVLWCEMGIENGDLEFVPITPDLIQMAKDDIQEQADNEKKKFDNLLKDLSKNKKKDEWNEIQSENRLFKTKFLKFDSGDVNIIQTTKNKGKESFMCLSSKMLKEMLDSEPTKNN